MSNARIQELLGKLKEELQTTELDDDNRKLMAELESDIEAMLDESNSDSDADSLLARTQQLDADFASKHPTAEGFMRELMEILARMGV
jgi:hypothetical protein